DEVADPALAIAPEEIVDRGVRRPLVVLEPLIDDADDPAALLPHRRLHRAGEVLTDADDVRFALAHPEGRRPSGGARIADDGEADEDFLQSFGAQADADVV